jgi:hypothetical protein
MANQLVPHHSEPHNRVPRKAPIVLPDSNRNRSCKLGPRMQWARVALALVVIFAIAYVLITPDPNDDVYGVLRLNHPATSQKVPAVSLWEFQIPVTVSLHLLSLPESLTRRLAAFELLDVISVCRC